MQRRKTTPNKWGWVNLNISIGKWIFLSYKAKRNVILIFFKEGNLLFVASSGYGKTLFLTTILMSLAKLNDVDFSEFLYFWIMEMVE